MTLYPGAGWGLTPEKSWEMELETAAGSAPGRGSGRRAWRPPWEGSADSGEASGTGTVLWRPRLLSGTGKWRPRAGRQRWVFLPPLEATGSEAARPR